MRRGAMAGMGWACVLVATAAVAGTPERVDGPGHAAATPSGSLPPCNTFAPGGWIAFGERPGERLGTALAVGDVNGDGFADIVTGAPGDPTMAGSGRVVAYLGSHGSLTKTWAWGVEGDRPGEAFGSAVAVGDVNGDGIDDIVIGSPGRPGTSEAGRVLAFLGAPSGPSKTPSWIATGDDATLRFGASLALVAGVTGEARTDLLVGAPPAIGSKSAGRALLFTSSSTGPGAKPSWTATGGPGAFGTTVASVGDVNADGFTDIAVGSPVAKGDVAKGSVALYLGSPSGLPTSPSQVLSGVVPDDGFGASVAGVGDVNGDGLVDVAIGAPGLVDRAAGRVFVFAGSAAGLVAEPTWTLAAPAPGDGFGRVVAAAGDVDGDRFADLLVGSPAGSGAVHLFRGAQGPPSGAPDWTSRGQRSGDGFGLAIVAPVRFDQAGRAHAIVAASTGRAGEIDTGRLVVIEPMGCDIFIDCPDNRQVSCGTSINFCSQGAPYQPEYSGDCTGIHGAGCSVDDPGGKCRIVTVTFYAADQTFEHTACCEQTIEFTDSTPPVVTCPDDTSVECRDDVPYADSSFASATDNCDAQVDVTLDSFSEDTTGNDCSGSVIRTWVFSDTCGNTSSCTQTVTFSDTTAPDITCPGDTAVDCNSDIPYADTSQVSTYDSCDSSPTVEYLDDTNSGGCPDTISRRYSSKDDCENVSYCTQTITVRYPNGPRIDTCPTATTVECTGSHDPADYPEYQTWRDSFQASNCQGTSDGITTSVDNDCFFGDPCFFFGFCCYFLSDPSCCSIFDALCGGILFSAGDAPPTLEEMSARAGITPEEAEKLVADPAAREAAIARSGLRGRVQPPLSPTPMGIGPGSCQVSSCNDSEKSFSVTSCGSTTSCHSSFYVVDTTPPVLTVPANETIECGGSPSSDSASATDICDSAPSVSGPSDDYRYNACGYVLTRTWTATDSCGNSTTAQQIVTTVDTTPPSITCPADVTVECIGDVPDPDPSLVSATDDCDPAPIVAFLDDSPPSGAGCPLTITRTYVATDACGNSATCTQTITIDDTQAPVITCPADTTVQCADDTAPANTGTPTATDNCGPISTSLLAKINVPVPGISYVDAITNQTCTNRYTITRTWKATDACGNAATCNQTITVNDTTPPVITCPANTSASCAGGSGDTGTATATDNCSGTVTVTHSDSTTSGTCDSQSIARTWTATDACGNSSSCVQTITVADTTPPTIACPPNVTVQCPGNVPAPGTPVATDDCPGPTSPVTHSDAITNQTCPNHYTLTRTYSATDACGNTGTCAQIITVNDTTAPVVTCPANVTVQCLSQVPPPGGASATDNCGGPPMTITSSDAYTAQTCPNRITLTRTYRATDACGNTGTCAQVITVNDTTPPTITCPTNRVVSCPSGATPVNTGYATGTDNCDPSSFTSFADPGGDPVPVVAITFTDATSGQTCANRYTITRTWRATDLCGNTATCNQTITVNDTTPPVITCPANATVQCQAEATPANAGTATATDNCGGTPTITHSDATSGQTCINHLTITRTWTATDSCGNAATCTQTITVNDNTPPTITCPANVTVECGGGTAPADTGTATATDNCTGAFSFTGGPGFAPTSFTAVGGTITHSDSTSPGSCPGNYTITRTWRATDECGNSRTCAQTITVNDTTPPTISCPGPAALQCSSDVPSPSPAGITTSDNCPGPSPTLSFSEATTTGSCIHRKTVTRTWTATDACGNTASCAQVFNVSDTTPPTISCPPPVSLQCSSDLPTPSPVGITTSDNCPGPAPTLSFSEATTNSTCLHRKTVTRTWTATDACGNTASCAQVFNISDTTPPTISCPPPVTLECSSDVPTPSPVGITTSDNCPGPSPTLSFSEATTNSTCLHRKTVTRTWTATDACGNTATCAQVFNVSDTTPPTISCPPPVSLQCARDVPTPSPVGVTTSDTCPGPSPTLSFHDVVTSQTCADHFTLTRTWTATDACGNTATCAQVFNVNDTTPPVISCPPPRTVSCGADATPANTGVATGFDNCAGAALPDDELSFTPSGGTATPVPVTFTDAVSAQTCANRYTITRTWRATDACGNTATCNQTITVNDTTPPVLTGMPANGFASCGSVPASTTPTASDNCGGTPTVTGPVESTTPGSCAGNYTLKRTWTATDACGNTASATQTIDVTDTRPPTFVGLPDDEGIECGATPRTYVVGATDACDPSPRVTGPVETSTPTTCGYMLARVWTATDACGNSATATQTIISRDTTPPTITCPATVTVDCASDVPAPDTSTVTASDSCSSATVTYQGQTTSGTCPQTITRTYRATDACGLTAECTQTITVRRSDAVTITQCPAATTVECTGSHDPSTYPEYQAWLDSFHATNCAGTTDGVITRSAPNGLCFDICDFALGCCLASGGTDSDCCGFFVFYCLGGGGIGIGSDPGGVPPDLDVVAQRAGVSRDEVDELLRNKAAMGWGPGAAVRVAPQLPSPLRPRPEGFGPTTEDCTVSDSCDSERIFTANACGDSTSCTSSFYVVDTTPPTLVGIPPNTTASCASVPDFPTTVTATDICDSNPRVLRPTVTVRPATCGYTLTRTWTAIDDCGNSATGSQTIAVSDQSPPTITCPAPLEVACRADVPPPATATVIAVDDCIGSPPVLTHVSDTSNGQSCPETITRTYRATDSCGNSVTCAQTITVTTDGTPTITHCPGDVTHECDETDPPLGQALIQWIESFETGGCTATTTVDSICDDACGGKCTAGALPVEALACVDGCTISYTFRFTAISACGTRTSCDATFSIVDTTPPVLHGVPDDQSIACGDPVPAPPTTVTATDSCHQGAPPEYRETRSTGACPLTITRTWTATDTCGNSASDSQTITVGDNTPPVISGVPAPATVQCAATIPAATVTASDDCDTSPTLTFADSRVNGSCTDRYTLTRTWTATDDCGHSTTAAQIISVSDTSAPTLNLPPNTTVECNAVPARGTPTATDNCDPAPVITYVGETRTDGRCLDVYTLTRTWRATDRCGNSATASQTINVNDTTPPVLTRGTIAACYLNSAAAQNAAVAATGATDACGGVVTKSASTTGACTATVRVYGTDRCGNETYVEYATRIDAGPPQLTPGTIAACYPTVAAAETAAIAATTASDFCGGAVTKTASTSGTCTATVTVTGRDACNNTAMTTYSTRIDNTAPTITRGSIAACYASTALAEAAAMAATSATDNCPGTITETASTSGTCSATVTVTERDGCGNQATTSYSTRIDTTAPVITRGTIGSCYTSIAAAEAAAIAATTATDACGGTVTKTAATVVTGCSATVTVTARDACSNGATTSYTTRVDTTAPTLSGVPANVTISCTGTPPAAATTVTATDNCDGPRPVTMTETRTNGACAGSFTITRTWTATDTCGNSRTGTQTITAGDTVRPTVTQGSTNLYCLWPPNGGYYCFSASQFRPTITDNCSAAVTWKFTGCASDQPDNAPGMGDGDTINDCLVMSGGNTICVRSERDGTKPAGRHYAVTIVATDGCGNQSLATRIGYVYVPKDSLTGCLSPP